MDTSATKTPLGPNVKRLLILKMSRTAIPSGGGVADALRFLSSKDSIVSGFRDAAEWTKAAIKKVREAGEPNPWKQSTDEEIAAELLRLIEVRKTTTV